MSSARFYRPYTDYIALAAARTPKGMRRAGWTQGGIKPKAPPKNHLTPAGIGHNI